MARIETSDVGGVTVVRFVDRQLFEENDVREVGDELFGLIDPDEGPPFIVLDFAGVELVSSAMLGKLIVVHRNASKAGGKLRLCRLSNNVSSVLDSTNLTKLFQVDRTLEESLGGFVR